MSTSLTEPLTLFKFVKTYTNLHEGAYPELNDAQTSRLTTALDQFAKSLGVDAYHTGPKSERFEYEKKLFLAMSNNNLNSYQSQYGHYEETAKDIQRVKEMTLKIADKFSNGDANRFAMTAFKNGELVGRLSRIEHGYDNEFYTQGLLNSVDSLLKALNTTLIELSPEKARDFSMTNIADAFYAMHSGGDQFLGMQSALHSVVSQLEGFGEITNDRGTFDTQFYGSNVLATLSVQQFGTQAEQAKTSSVPPAQGATIDKPLADFSSFLSYPVRIRGDIKEPTPDDAVFLLKTVNELYSRMMQDERHDNSFILDKFERFKDDLNMRYVSALKGYAAVYREPEKAVDHELERGM